MSESMDTMIFHEDIIVESVSSTKRIEKGNIAPPIASSKQTEDITTKKDRKRRNTNISDIKLSCKKRKATSPSPLTTVESNESLEAQVESLRSEQMLTTDSFGSNSTIVNQVSNRRSHRDRKTPNRLLTTAKETNLKSSLVTAIDADDRDRSDEPVEEASSMILKRIDQKIKIIDSKDPHDHTCMFYAIYNSFRSEEEKFAFSDGNLADPSKSFIDLFINKDTTEKFRNRIAKEGYTGKDMRLYLQKLVQNKRIREYDWLVKEKWSISSFFCSGSKKPGSYLLFGFSVVSDKKSIIIKRLKEVGERETGKHINLVNLAKFNEYIKWTDEYLDKVAKKYLYQHGAVLQRDSEGNTFYYDTGARFVMKEPTIEKIAEKLVGIYKGIEFKIYLHSDPGHRKFRKGEYKKALMRNDNEGM